MTAPRCLPWLSDGADACRGVMSSLSGCRGEQVTSSKADGSESLFNPMPACLPRSVVLVAPTSTSAKPASFRPEIDINGTPTRVLVEQVGAVDHGRLGALAGHVSPEELWGIDAALLTVLGLT